MSGTIECDRGYARDSSCPGDRNPRSALKNAYVFRFRQSAAQDTLPPERTPASFIALSSQAGCYGCWPPMHDATIARSVFASASIQRLLGVSRGGFGLHGGLPGGRNASGAMRLRAVHVVGAIRSKGLIGLFLLESRARRACLNKAGREHDESRYGRNHQGR